MQTTIHAYHFDTRNPSDAAAYKTLCASMRDAGLKCFETWGDSKHYLPSMDGKTITLDVSTLFDNQWNTVERVRVFDWAQDYPIELDEWRKQGHYLDITHESNEQCQHNLYCADDGTVWFSLEH